MSMTENEAKILLCQMYLPHFDEEEKQALNMAIEALEEIQPYRALEEKLNRISVEQVVNGFISTVEKETQEGYERGRILTNKEADEWNELQVIGTVEEFKALKEKSVAKKPIKHGSYYVCPCCGNTEIEYCNEVDCRTIRLKRCILCGQKLDW